VSTLNIAIVVIAVFPRPRSTQWVPTCVLTSRGTSKISATLQRSCHLPTSNDLDGLQSEKDQAFVYTMRYSRIQIDT